MRANIAKVIAAFLAGKPAKGDSKATCSTDGQVIYSYALPIAWRHENGEIEVLDVEGYRIGDVLRAEYQGRSTSGRYSRTTASQVKACVYELMRFYDRDAGRWVPRCTKHEDCRKTPALGAACHAERNGAAA